MRFPLGWGENNLHTSYKSIASSFFRASIKSGVFSPRWMRREEPECVSIHDWVAVLYSRNWHNPGNHLFTRKNKKKSPFLKCGLFLHETRVETLSAHTSCMNYYPGKIKQRNISKVFHKLVYIYGPNLQWLFFFFWS